MHESRSVEGWRQAGEQLLKDGAPLLAYDALVEGLAAFPTDTRLRQMTALALARSGASFRAADMLSTLLAEGHDDEETVALLARTYKDLATEADADGERRGHLTRAFELYRKAFRASGGYYSGINAATMALLVDQPKQAGELARLVQQRCTSLLEKDTSQTDSYWVLATLGEASLLLNDRAAAEAWYEKAFAAASGRLGDLVSTRRNARLILRHLDRDTASIDRLLLVPSVLVFVGHLVDRPDRPEARFPPHCETAVRDAIHAYLRKNPCGFGYAAAACGSDILFLEALPSIGAESHVVLPYEREQFREDSVDVASGGDWSRRFDAVLANARDVVVSSEQRMARGGASFEYGFLMLDGIAAIRADELDTELRCLAVWDGREGDGPGGTGTSVESWRAAGRKPDIIDLRKIHSNVAQELSPAAVGKAEALPHIRNPDAAYTPQIVGMLFADVRGFSKLTEEEMPLFVDHFLGAVASEVARASAPPVYSNTWGDGLYFVFSSVAESGVFALNLRDAIRAIDWRTKGFRNDLSLRIGLHVGPAYQCIDPVTRRVNFIGAHVSHAARIEPITPPGEVYASQAFAAIAHAEGVREFTCAYVGQTPLAKHYGTFPTYVVHRKRAPSA